jgi:serine/threonine protein kinase
MAGPMPPSTLAPGSVVLSRLRILRVLGKGGMGVVYEVDDLVRNGRVALKVLSAERDDPELRARFEREARAASMLRSPHTAQVLEIGELEDATPYFVMEYLDGEPLDRGLAHGELLPCATAVDYVLQALDALIEAHAVGLVHRDLKPANIFLSKLPGGTDAVIKVLDFGVVKEVFSDGATLTQTGSSIGTPAYMAPEQVRAGAVVDQRADIWALGVTLFELLTGKLPFDAPSVPGTLAKILRDDPPSLRFSRKDVPVTLDAIVRKCLAKEPSQRFDTAADLASELRAIQPTLPTNIPQHTIRLPTTVDRKRLEMAKTALAVPQEDGELETRDVALRTTAGTHGRRRLALTVTSIFVVVCAGILFGMALVTRAKEKENAAATATEPEPPPSATTSAAPVVTPSASAAPPPASASSSARRPHRLPKMPPH